MAVLYKSIQFKASMIRQQNIVEGVVAKKKTAVGRGSIRALRGPLAEQFLGQEKTNKETQEDPDAWAQYAQALLISNEMFMVD